MSDLKSKFHLRREGKAPKEKAPVKKTPVPAALRVILAILGGVLAGIALFLLLRLGGNGLFTLLYKTGHYAPGLERALLAINVPSGYVPWYNMGNAYFRKEDYQKAVNAYYQALTFENIPEQKECAIRINLALAILKQSKFEDLLDEETRQSVVARLLTARQILVEKGCAHEDDEEGHNAQAQQLKDEIDEILKEFAPPSSSYGGQDQQNDNPDQNDEGDGGGGSGSSRENQIREKIEENRQDALEERAEERSSLRDDLDIFGEHDDAYEYDGERW